MALPSIQEEVFEESVGDIDDVLETDNVASLPALDLVLYRLNQYIVQPSPFSGLGGGDPQLSDVIDSVLREMFGP